MNRFRKPLQIVILLAIFAVGAFTLASHLFSSEEIPDTGSAAPDFSLSGMNGDTFRLADYQGKPVIINFWATYCPPCVREMPLIQKYYDQYKDEGLVVLGVNENEPVVTAKGFVRQYKVTFPILMDKDTIRKKYGVTSYPTTFFVDAAGKIRMIMEGELNEATLASGLSSIMQP